MTKQEAVKVLDQVCGVYKGTREEHNILIQALKVIESLEEPKEEKKEK